MTKEKESKEQAISEKDDVTSEEVSGGSSSEGDKSGNEADAVSNGKASASHSPDKEGKKANVDTDSESSPPDIRESENAQPETTSENNSLATDPLKSDDPETTEGNMGDSMAAADNSDKKNDPQSEDVPVADKASEKVPTETEEKSEKITEQQPAETAAGESPHKKPELESDQAGKEKEEEDEAESDEGSKKKSPDLKSEEDLNEKDDDDHHDDDEEIDFSELSKEELVDHIKELAKSDQVVKAEKEAREIKSAFNEIRDKERKIALDKFVAEGGESGDFAYRPDELTLRFDANYQLIRDKKSSFVKNKEQQKETNYKRKEDILEKLREFVDSEETNISFETFKTLQEEWKSIGPVPGGVARTLWANYNALVDRFYDKRSIYFELKELDRKKNLESKQELCVRAEALAEVTNINDAIKDLNDLHHEFKHIGPVPKEEQEPLWQRFKAASDAVYERRKEFVEKLKGELETNLKVKLELTEKVKDFASFDSDRIKAWNEKTKELLDIQKNWENTGGLPRARAKEVNRAFWSSFKQFFSNKNHFFKKLDAEREKNLEKKKEMVERAKKLSESDDWHATAEALKALQREWKDVGPVPGKFRESVYKEFKSACDQFFDRKRANQDGATKEYAENYKLKLEICSRIEKLAKGDKNNLDEFKSLQEEYNETGFVPRNKITEIRNTYSDVVNKYVKELEGLSKEEKQRIKIENQVSDILHSPNADQKLYRKEQSLRKQISSIENDIALWKNNLEFFAESKKANKLKDEFQSKIESASDELKQLKQQLRIIRTA